MSNYCWQPSGSDIVYALDWTGGVSDDGPYPGRSSANDIYKASMPVGTGFSLNMSRASKIGFAVRIGPARLGQTSGHSTNVDMRWDAKRGNGLWYCGSNDYLTGSPGVRWVSNRG